jgi:hypothetical protein
VQRFIIGESDENMRRDLRVLIKMKSEKELLKEKGEEAQSPVEEID